MGKAFYDRNKGSNCGQVRTLHLANDKHPLLTLPSRLQWVEIINAKTRKKSYGQVWDSCPSCSDSQLGKFMLDRKASRLIQTSFHCDRSLPLAVPAVRFVGPGCLHSRMAFHGQRLESLDLNSMFPSRFHSEVLNIIPSAVHRLLSHESPAYCHAFPLRSRFLGLLRRLSPCPSSCFRILFCSMASPKLRSP